MLKAGRGERLEELTLNCEPRTMSEYIAVMQFISVHRRLKKLNVDIQVSQYSKREVDFASLDFVLDTALWKGVMATIEDLTFAVRVGLLCFTPPINLCTNLKALRHHRLTNSLQPFRLPANAERNLTSLTFAFDTRISFHVVGSCFTVLHTCERLQAFTLSCPGFLIDETSNEILNRLTNFIRTLTPRPHLKILDIAIPIPTPALQPIAEFISKCNIHTIMLGLDGQISDQLRYTVTSLIKSPIILKLPYIIHNPQHLRIPIPHEAAMRELLSSSLVKPWGTWSLDSLHLDMAFHSQVPPKPSNVFKELYLSVIAFETLRPTYSCLAGLKSAVGTLKIIGRENLGDEEVRLEKESRRKGGVSVMILNGLYGVYGK
ncbi:hypothetical protein BC829DRAFT_411656 [Chytridium lagenaria]|nr:hypothetical protein BC829DRAFT_411656 [Chytridium lagenaria]